MEQQQQQPHPIERASANENRRPDDPTTEPLEFSELSDAELEVVCGGGNLFGK